MNEYERSISKLKQFANENRSSEDTVSADSVVEEFLDNYIDWKCVIDYITNGEALYGAALLAYSDSLCSSNHLSEDAVRLLQNESLDYERNVRYMYRYKAVLFSNLVTCLYKLSLTSKEELKEYLKKAIYYSLAESNHSSYQVECYKYKSISEFLLDSLENEMLSISSPAKFNDPFDCPIFELLNMYGDDLSRLAVESYKECLKITCFMMNTKLDPEFDEYHNPVWQRKHDENPKEYLNELMWAHYADNHKGVCIKYHFNNNFTRFADGENGQITFFRDVEYTSDMDVYRRNGAINLIDAFFVKSKLWENENELRLLAYDPKGKGEGYDCIDAKNCIAEVYFGLKCSESDKFHIMDIVRGRKWVMEKNFWDDDKQSFVSAMEEHPVEFFQIAMDYQHFGKLKAIKIQ